MFSCGVFFLVFLSKCLSKYPSSTKPSLPRKISGYIPALRDHYFCKVIHLTCLTGFWIRLCLDNSSVICTVILCIYCTRYVQNSDIFRTLFIQDFIFTEIGKPCVTMEIQNHDILAILEYSEPWNIYNLTHIQNPLKDLIWTVLRK